MPLELQAISELKEYVQLVMERAGHHANSVRDVALTIVGAIVWRMDDDDTIQVMAREGETKNVLWVHIGKQRYALSYEHESRAIELRRGSVRGPAIASFTNKSPHAEVRRTFAAL